MQSNGNSKRLVVMGSALKTGKNSAVNLARKFFFGKYHSSSWSAKRLMGGGGHHIRVRKRRRIHTPSNKTGEMRHIHHNKRSDTLGNFIEFKKFQHPFTCEIFHLVYYFISAVVAVTWVSFRILICKNRAKRQKHLTGNIIFRCNKIQRVFLPRLFFLKKPKRDIVPFHSFTL